MTDLTGKISSGLFALSTGNGALTLIIGTAIVIVLGMGMPTPAVYALSAVLVAPALLALKIPMLQAHLFIVYFASMSAITPPVAVAAFAASTIANANPMKIGLQCCRLAVIAFVVPYVFIYNPALLLIGSTAEVIFAIVCACAAVAALVSASEGYFYGSVPMPWRLALLVSGAGLATGELAPALFGGCMLLAAIGWRRVRMRAPTAAADHSAADAKRSQALPSRHAE